jgi:selenoprotein W-related protein
VSLATDLLKNYEAEIESVSLIPSDGGRYEVSVDDRLIYSKLETGRHPAAGEVLELFAKSLKK